MGQARAETTGRDLLSLRRGWLLVRSGSGCFGGRAGRAGGGFCAAHCWPAAAISALWVLVPIGTALMATHRPREAASVPDLGRASVPVTVRTADGLDLNCRYAASRNGAAVIVFPGTSSRAQQARVLAKRGYGVLLLDMRGYCASDGDPNMFGWGAAKDIDAGVAFLRSRPGCARRAHRGRRLLGRRGSDARGRRGEPGSARRCCRRSRRAFRSESALRGPKGWFSLPSDAVQTAAVAVLSGDSPPPSLVELVPRIAPRALFLIGAGRDNGGEDLQPHYFDAAKEPKAYWKIPEAGHTGGFDARPAEYTRRLLAFFDGALAPRRGA